MPGFVVGIEKHDCTVNNSIQTGLGLGTVLLGLGTSLLGWRECAARI